MRRSEALFVPSLKMEWVWLGTSFELHRNGVMIWTSIIGAQPWDYPNGNSMARYLLAYMNTPVEQLRRREIEHIQKAVNWYNEKPLVANFNLLAELLLAADRRIGKNLQSLRLFVEPDIRVRNIIGHRV
jgi:hypothetical protein